MAGGAAAVAAWVYLLAVVGLAAAFLTSSALRFVSNMTSDLRPTRSGRWGHIILIFCLWTTLRILSSFSCVSLLALESTTWLRVIDRMESARVSTLEKNQLIGIKNEKNCNTHASMVRVRLFSWSSRAAWSSPRSLSLALILFCSIL